MSDSDFVKLEQLDKLWREGKPEKFERPPGELYGVELNPNLTEEEIEDANFWKKYQRGYMLIISPPGSGKGCLVNMIAFKMKHYFGKTPVLDYMPCKPFGYYEFFDTNMLTGELDKMAGKEKLKTDKAKAELVDDIAQNWVESKKHMFRHSTLVLDEFVRYMDKRRPHNPVGVTLSHLFTVWRHLDILILAVATSNKYLDFRAYEELTGKISCSWSKTRPMTYIATLLPVKFVEHTGVLGVTGMPDFLVVDIEKPQPMLKGLGWKDIFNTEQDIALGVAKSLRREQ